MEIVDALQLTPEQRRRIAFHSVDNVPCVLIGNFRLIGDFVGAPATFAPQIARLEEVLSHIDDPVALLDDLRWFEANHGALRDALDASAPTIAAAPEPTRGLAERCARAIHAVLDVVVVRVGELLVRAEIGEAWLAWPVALLRRNLRQVMTAIADNSLGRSRVVYDGADRAPGDYLVEMEFAARDGDAITMPDVLQDCLRDLVCNARKYSSPGATIRASLVEGAETLTVSVADDGWGISETEIVRLVGFHARGAEVDGVRTMGAGYGLTKAWFVTHQLGGRMWIESEPGVGTTVTIRIARPLHAMAAAARVEAPS